jgi:serine/threonine protein kinase
MLSHVSLECIDLIEKMLVYDPEKRATPNSARNHPCFKEIREQEMRNKMRQAPSKALRERDQENSYDKQKKNRSNYSSDSSVGSNQK